MRSSPGSRTGAGLGHASLPVRASSAPKTSPSAITRARLSLLAGRFADRRVHLGRVDAEQLGGDFVAVVLGEHVAVACQAVRDE